MDCIDLICRDNKYIETMLAPKDFPVESNPGYHRLVIPFKNIEYMGFLCVDKYEGIRETELGFTSTTGQKFKIKFRAYNVAKKILDEYRLYLKSV